uniref:Tpr-related protein family member n=1 Tax=Theileria annulata TaxID=5874 RepID=A0A3B0NF18_THEAN
MHYFGLLIATFFPPVIVATLIRVKDTTAYSPKTQHTFGPEGFPGWTKSFPYGTDGTQKTANASFYHAFDILIVIKISLAVIFIYSIQYTLNRTGGANEFKSTGTITITVGATNFKDLGSAGTKVDITGISGSIKKYKDKEKPPDDNNITEIGGSGINENLPEGTKLEIDATGSISDPDISGSEVTIKGDLTVNSEGKALGSSALTLGGDDGLSGSITPTGDSTNVTIKGGSSSNITLRGNALNALLSLTKNTVTLSGGASTFRSSASITVTRTAGNANFKELPVDSQGLQITGITGSIKNSDGSELKTGTQLKVDTKLEIEAKGTLSANTASGAVTAPVKLTGTIVVTSDNVAIGTPLEFGGGPGRSGVTGTLTLESNAAIKSSSSNLTITSGAYGTLKTAGDTTSSSFTIGAADPRVPANATGGAETLELNNEDSFTKYWHLLPPNNYTPNDIPYWTSISPILMVLLIATIFPPIIVATLIRVEATQPYSPKSEINTQHEVVKQHHLEVGDTITKLTQTTTPHLIPIIPTDEHAILPVQLVDDYLIVYIDIWVAIIISFVAAVVWTVGYGVYKDGTGADGELKHIFTYGFTPGINPSMVSTLLIVLVGMELAYGYFRDTQKENVITYHNTKGTENTVDPPNVVVSNPTALNPGDLTPENIESITVIDSKGKSTTYTKDQATPGAHVLTIKKEGGEGTEGPTATFKKGDPAPDKGAPNTITLTTTDRKTITITGITDTP